MGRLKPGPSMFAGNKKIGSSSTYIYVDTINNKIQLFVNSVKVEEWS